MFLLKKAAMPLFFTHIKCRRKSFLIFFITSFLFFSLFTNTAVADSRYSRMTNYPVDFSLSFSHTDLELEANYDTYSINQRRISAALFQIVSPSLKTGLNLGSTYLGLDNDAATSGIDLNGNHIGFTVIGARGSNPRIGLRAQYLYQEVKGSNNLRSATLSWLEWHTEAFLTIDLGSYWTLNTAAGLVGIDARRRVKGDINNTLKLKQDASFQGTIGIDLNTQPDGKISLIFSRGINNGTLLAFAREF